MTGFLAELTLAAFGLAVLAGVRFGRYLRWVRAWLAAHEAEVVATEVAYRAELAALRAARAAAEPARVARSAVKAAAGRDLRPWAFKVGDRP